MRAPIAAALAALLVPSTVAAQSTTFAVDRLSVAMGGAPGDGIAIWRPGFADTTDKVHFFGQLGLGASWNPLRVSNYIDNRNDQGLVSGDPLTRQVITYFDAGVEIADRVSLHVAFPLIIDQAGNPTLHVPGEPGEAVSPAPVAAGDLRVEGRVVVYRSATRDFKAGINAAAYVPTGDRYAYGGDPGAGAVVGFAVEYDAKFVAVTLDAAYRFRPALVFNELVVSSEVTYGLGVFVPLRRDTLRLGAEVFGAFGVDPTKYAVANAVAPPGKNPKSNVGDLDATPLEWMAEGRQFFTKRRQVYVGVGAGTRLTGGYAPDFRAVAVVGGWFGFPDAPARARRAGGAL